MSREYPAFPLPGVGVIIWDGERILLVQRGKPPNAGKWSIPGGLIELGETVVEAARREVVEECGIEIDLPELLTTIDLVVLDEHERIRYHYLLVELTAHWIGGTALAGDDALGLRWVGLAELAELDLVEGTRQLLALAWEREHGRHHRG